MIIKSQKKDLGGFSVRRCLPDANRKMVGPWIFFDHFGPVDFAAGEGIDVRPHPHIGLATVTYLFAGEIVHRDSLGYVQTIRPGEINLMIAGKGIVHSERTGLELRAKGHKLHGLQTWLALPDDYQETESAFYHYGDDEIPVSHKDGVSFRVLMGEAFGLKSPVLTYSETLYAEVRLAADATLQLPCYSEIAVYVVSGELSCAEQNVRLGELIVLDDFESSSLHATTDVRIAIFGGDPVGHRHIWWNFVSNSTQRIEHAAQQWRRREFKPVPGDDEFIPLPG